MSNGTPQPLGIVTGSEVLVDGGIPRTRKKVAIVGFAPSSMRDVMHMFDDPDLEVWPLNQIYMVFPELVDRATRWFQIHHRHSYDVNVLRDHSHHQWMTKQTKFPIYMQEVQQDVPMSMRFPKEAIVAKFGTYFTNSISWMIALAIYEKFKEIFMFGVDMATDTEYSYERPSVEFFVGWAKGAGIKFHIPEKSDICKAMWLYPYEDSAPFRTKIEARIQELRQRVNQCDQMERENHDQKMALLGAQDNMLYVKKAWEMSQKELVTLDNRMTFCRYCETNHDFRVTPCPEKK